MVTPSLELGFKERRWKRLSGSTPAGAWVTRIIPLCSLGAFTVLKAHLGTAQRTKTPMTSSTVASRRKWTKGKGRGGLMAQPRPQANRRLNPRWHISIIMETTPGRNRLQMPTWATPLTTPVGGILRHPRTVPQKSQEAFTATVGGPREPRSRGKGSLSWAEGTTTDAWPSGSTICSLAGGRSPGPWTMAPGLERGPPYQGLRGDRRASPRGGFPQLRENVRSPVTLDPSPFFCTFPKTQEI